MKATLFHDFDKFEAEGEAGAVFFMDDGAMIKCPGCGRESFLLDRSKAPERPSWEMKRQELTFTPSVHHSRAVGNNPVCGWHGFLSGGKWRSV